MGGFAIYPALAMTNHECLTNCVRYDDFDGTDRTGLFPHSQAPPNNMLLQLRTLHALPQGEELLLGYFPLDWDLEERRERLAQDYGFECMCGRCRLEASWESNEPVTGRWEVLKSLRTTSAPFASSTSVQMTTAGGQGAPSTGQTYARATAAGCVVPKLSFRPV